MVRTGRKAAALVLAVLCLLVSCARDAGQVSGRGGASATAPSQGAADSPDAGSLTASARQPDTSPDSSVTGSTVGVDPTTDTNPNASTIPDNPLIVATCADYVPFSFMLDGEPAGLDMDLAAYIGKRMGVDVEVRDMLFDEALTSVANGEAHMAIMALNHTEDRAADMDFSKEYYVPGKQCIIVAGAEAPETLDGLTVACMNGGIAHTLLDVNFPEAEILRTESDMQALEALTNGDADAAAVSEIVGDIMCIRQDNLRMADIDLGPARVDGLCVAVQKDQPGLLDSVNSAIDDAIKLELIDRWMENAKQKAATLHEIY